jgi:hypothetical protein
MRRDAQALRPGSSFARMRSRILPQSMIDDERHGRRKPPRTRPSVDQMQQGKRIATAGDRHRARPGRTRVAKLIQNGRKTD